MGFSRLEYWSGVPLPSPKDSINCSYLYYFIYNVLFLLLAQTSLAQEITQKTVRSMSPNRGARRRIPGDWVMKKCHVSWEEEVVAGWGFPVLGLGSHRVSPPGSGHMKVREFPRQVGKPSRPEGEAETLPMHPQARQVLGETTWSEVGRRVGMWEVGEPRTGKPRGGKAGQFRAVLSQFPLR